MIGTEALQAWDRGELTRGELLSRLAEAVQAGEVFDPPSWIGNDLAELVEALREGKTFTISGGTRIMDTHDRFMQAYETRDLKTFLGLVFPPEWSAISARILESGATMATNPCAWAPRWSEIPPTVRNGATPFEAAVKSCIYRSHDCIHQLWGLPIPGPHFTEDDFYVYKRSQMCGEVAVLTLTEFVLCSRLAELYPKIRHFIEKRNAIQMLEGPLRGRSWLQIAARLDGILHKMQRPRWLREHAASMAFADDYVPMLEADRKAIDHNWQLMKKANWHPDWAPNARYNPDTDGLELTSWMVTDFFHLLDTDPVVDERLAEFNRTRRLAVVLPEGWNQPE